MSTEAEKYLKEASHVRNETNQRGRIINPAVRYLRHNEREKRQEEANRIRQMLQPTNIEVAKMGEQSVAMARRHLNALEEDLELRSPPSDLSGEAKDAIHKELKREEEIYRQGLLSHEEMRRNGVGAVDRHLKHQKANKDRALKIKNLRLLLNPNSDAQDLCNLEDLRPSGVRLDGAATFDPNAQIPGHFAMTPQAKANWPEGMPEYGEVNSPLKQAEDKEKEELKARLAELEAQIKRDDEIKAKRKERGKKLAEAGRKAREAKKAAPQA